MTNKKEELTFKDIKDKIYTIRDQKVMLDSDLAKIYGYEVKRLNEQVKRNIERFPEDFFFQLNEEETEAILRSQIATSSWGGSRYSPYAFTEQGIYMLATVLRGELAEKQSIFLIRAFKQMKDYIYENRNLLTPIEEDKLLSVNIRLESHDIRLNNQNIRIDDISKSINTINEKIDVINQNFIDDKVKDICILDGEKFEADMAYLKIISSAKQTIYLIDDYPGNKVLELLSNKKENVNVIIFTDNKRKQRLTSSIINDFNNEFPTLNIKPNKKWHDRYFIIDYGTNNEAVYTSGPSIEDAGGKIGMIIRINDIEHIRNSINSLLKQEDLDLKQS